MKLHLGCGWRDFGEDWVHIDGGDYPHLRYYDITSFPFENNSAEVIYASHVIGYFNRQEIIPILKEWYRVLKPGGQLRIAVPNFKALVELYLNSKCPLNKILGPLYGEMDMGGSTIYYKTTYDLHSLKNLLQEIGFLNIEKYNWEDYPIHVLNDDHSQAYIPHMDKQHGTLISLNIRCTKL